MKIKTSVLAFTLSLVALVGHSAPILSVVAVGTPSTFSASIPVGTATFSVDLRLNPDGNPVSSLQLAIVASGPSAVFYSAAPLTVFGTPFTASDLLFSTGPIAGAAVANDASGTTIFFKSTAGDYSAASFLNAVIARYEFNTSSLGSGSYTFTPTAPELTNGPPANANITSFGTPNSFTLTVTPEPTTAALMMVGLVSLAARRRRQAK